MKPRYPMIEKYDKDHRARYIEEGQVTKIVKKITLILVHEVCKTNKHFYMSLVRSFDPPSICASTSPDQPVAYR
jgi:hypothetical protein